MNKKNHHILKYKVDTLLIQWKVQWNTKYEHESYMFVIFVFEAGKLKRDKEACVGSWEATWDIKGPITAQSWFSQHMTL